MVEKSDLSVTNVEDQSFLAARSKNNMSLYPKLFAAKTDCTSLDRPNV
jgi:hypothetical protein